MQLRTSFSSTRRVAYTIGYLCVSLFLSSCYTTSIGLWDQQSYAAQDYGPWRTVHVCVYLDEGVSRDQAISLMSDWTTKDEVAAYYRMDIVLEGFWTLPCQGFLHNSIMDEVAHIPLQGNCDRVFYFASHSAADYVYANLPMVVGLFPPEVMGEVDDATMTHGFAFASSDGLLTALMGPQHTTWHEFYHLLGSCPHAFTLGTCYARISMLKRLMSDDGFYPSMNVTGNGLFLNRNEVNRTLAGYSDSIFP